MIMLTLSSLISQLRPLIHPMLVHFPIALLFASVALDWLGYWLKHPNLTRAGFYTLVLGALGAGLAALSGPDEVSGGAAVSALIASHQTFASLTVLLAVAMVAARFLATRGIGGTGALVYLAGTLALLVFVTITGYFGGELTYHHAVGVAGGLASAGAEEAEHVRALLPAKPITALLGFLSVVGLGGWLTFGARLAPAYYADWWSAVKRELANASAPLWTLQRGRVAPDISAARTAKTQTPYRPAPNQPAPSRRR